MAIEKITNPAAAASAYSGAQRAGAGAGMAGGDISFGDLIKSGLQSAANSVKGAQESSAAAVAGTANLSDVVQSITKAELTLQTVVAIRDRMVAAYQEILRMPI